MGRHAGTGVTATRFLHSQNPAAAGVDHTGKPGLLRGFRETGARALLWVLQVGVKRWLTQAWAGWFGSFPCALGLQTLLLNNQT